MGGLDVVDPRYGPLLDRARAVLEADERILRVEVGGSIGAGTADRWSDLDLQVVVDPEHFDAVQADWPRWLAEITPTVFARTPIAPFIVNAITDEGLTLDLALFPGEVWSFPPPRYTAGMLSGMPFDDVGPALEYAVAEQLRGMAGPFISLLQREEHVRHLTGVTHLLMLLNVVFLAETGNPPLGKHWNEGLTEEQRAAVAGLPPVSATTEGLTAFGMGLAQMVVERARPLFPRYDLEWPTALAEVTATRVHAELGIDELLAALMLAPGAGRRAPGAASLLPPQGAWRRSRAPGEPGRAGGSSGTGPPRIVDRRRRGHRAMLCR